MTGISLEYGEVVAVRNRPLRVRATIPGMDNMLTPWMLVIQPRTKGTRHYDPPAEGEQVACLLMDNFETGLCLGSVYSDADEEPVSGARFLREFSDGTVIGYNPATHELTLEAKGDIRLTSTSKISLIAPSISVNGS